MGSPVGPIAQTAIAISLIDLIVGIILSIVIGLGIVWIYRWTHRGLNYERSFLVTLLLIGPIISLIMMLIGSNLALSLGMVGSLSIIRFRTVIKDSRDMIFLFWMIAVGLGCGTSNWIAIIIASIFIAGVILILHYVQYGQVIHSDFVLVVGGEGQVAIDAVKQTVAQYSAMYQLRSYEVINNGWEIVFEVRCMRADMKNEQEMIVELKRTKGVNKVSLLIPQLALPV